MADFVDELDRLAIEAQRDDLPRLLGAVVAVEARIRLRLVEPVQTQPAAQRPLDAAEAAAIAGSSKRWILQQTRGQRFRCDLSRKQPRFDEAGLRAWLAAKSKRRK